MTSSSTMMTEPVQQSVVSATPSAEIKLIAFDLDGTLLNDDLQASPAVLKMLNRVRCETDVQMVVATGRMFASALPFAQALGFHTPVVSCQGGMTRDTGAGYPIRHHLPIPLDTAHMLIETLSKLDVTINVYIDDVLHTNASEAIAGWYANLARIRPHRVSDLRGATHAPPTKIVMIDASEEAQASIDEAKGLLSQIPGLSWCQSRPGFLEIMHEHASKWTAVNRIAQEWGIAPEHVMAIGDHENDLPMILQAGVGVAMKNGPTHVQAQAPYVTASVYEDGAVQAVERFVFKAS